MAMSLEDELKTLRHAMELVENQRDELRSELNEAREEIAQLKEEWAGIEHMYQDAVSEKDELEGILKEVSESQDQNIKLINELKRELKAQGRETVLEPGQEITITIKVGR
ncbi:MAG: hypothetical protein WC279_14765 [Sulfurimonas sp.]|jgi:chromosome segregation ATPase|uniref:hypothetical protein n=1 Tax=Sulfurimonas sp. TaxID=2022749 RepID=UPI003562A331|nr:hypothetical protein [Dehalococcoidia bacterium]